MTSLWVFFFVRIDFLRRCWAAVGGAAGLAIWVILLAAATPVVSRQLDHRTRAAQTALTDLKAFPTDDLKHYRDQIREAENEDRLAERWQRLDFLQRLEWLSCDWRFSWLQRSSSARGGVGLVLADDLTIDDIADGRGTGEPFDLFWPRWPVLGRVLRELRAEGATAIGFDWLLQELQREAGRREYDDLFAQELKQPGAPALLAIAPQQLPAPLFQFQANGVGDVSAIRDADSVTRRIRAYTDFRQFNPLLGYLAHAKNWTVGLEDRHAGLWLRTTNANDRGRLIPLKTNGTVDVPYGRRPGITQSVPLMVTNRVWHLGLALAARALGADLSRSGLREGELQLCATNGTVLRRIPADEFGYLTVNWGTHFKLLVDWTAPDPSGTEAKINVGYRVSQGLPFENLVAVLQRDLEREAGRGAILTNHWTNQLVIVGSVATANNLTDRGSTPLGSNDFLVGTHLNVAEMALTGAVIREVPTVGVAVLVALLASLSSGITWKVRGIWAPLSIVVLVVAWVILAVWAFTVFRCLLPVAHPVLAGLIFPYGAMLSARATFEQRERQRIRSVFAKMVSPDIVQEMLNNVQVELRGVRRELSVLFADVRGFTALTDRTHAEAEQYVQRMGLTGAAAEAHHDARAHEVLDTVNLYLGGLADVVKFHQGTLDKYIGDCVMAFWGAPIPNASHAVQAVVAAIDAQRMIARLNLARAKENERRAALAAVPDVPAEAAGPQLPLLALGTGVNTGMVTVGLMGSEAHVVNYTVFGREVNLASRLEGVSGHARIVIGETTFRTLMEQASQLAGLCTPLEAVLVKGFRAPVKVYEVRWQEAETLSGPWRWYEATPSPAFMPWHDTSRGPRGGGSPASSNSH
jgi:class 3 adenylate cyclase